MKDYRWENKRTVYCKPRLESRKLLLIANMFGSQVFSFYPDFRDAPRRDGKQDDRKQ
jgi:hypothetical protein